MIKNKKTVLYLIVFFSSFFLFCTLSVKIYSQPAGSRKMPDEINALYRAYSQFIDEIKYVNNDWLITVGGVDLYWAGGRLLPPDKKPYENEYRSYGFYKYPDKLPEIVKEADARMLERISRFTSSRRNLVRDNTFLEILYGGQTRREIQQRLTTINFLGYRVQVHESIADRYRVIDREIRAAASKNPEVAEFLSSLGSVATFMWREIEESRSRSYHSFGIAVDLNPRQLGNKQIYWKWTSVYNEKWYTVPYSQRWMVHPEVVRIFEKYGFIWGGKWLPFDNMHFEYRPEILIFSGREVRNP